MSDLPDQPPRCRQHRHSPKFQKQRDARPAELQKQTAPLKKECLDHYVFIHRLKFEEMIAQGPPLETPSQPPRQTRMLADKLHQSARKESRCSVTGE